MSQKASSTASRVSLEQRESRSDALARVRALAFLTSAGGALDRTTLLRKLKIDACTFKKLILLSK